MTRLLALAIAALALLAWLNLRDLLRRASYEQVTDPADDVQPPDPVTTYPWPHPDLGVSERARGWTPRPPVPPPSAFDSRLPMANLEPLTASDRDWLDQTVRSHLHPAT